MKQENRSDRSYILESPAQSSTDLEVLRQQLLHVRQKYEILLLSKRRRLARAFFRIRSHNRRRWSNLQGHLLGHLLEETTNCLNKQLNELTETYIKTLEEGLRKTLEALYEEEEAPLIQKAVERLHSSVADISPRSSYRIILNSVDYSKIAEGVLPRVPLDHTHEVKKGTAVLISPMGEVVFDWLTPLQNTLKLSEDFIA